MRDVLSLKQAIKATIRYFALLKFAPTISEIERYLYGWSAPVEVIEETIREMPELAHAHGYYFLKGHGELAEQRKEREKVAKSLWKRALGFRWLLGFCPFVRMVSVCNSVALGNLKKTSDIDLFIVTAPGRLWTARFCMKLLTGIFGMRAHHEKIAGRFCLSFFVSERAMDLVPLAHDFDPHLAYFVATAVPLFGKKTYHAFLTANEKWLLPYFRRKIQPRLEKLREPRASRAVRWIFEKILFIFGESLFYRIQITKDKERKKQFPDSEGIVFNKDIFKFHEKDPRREIAEKFEKGSEQQINAPS